MQSQLGKELASIYSKSVLEQIANHADLAAGLVQERAEENYKLNKKIDWASINDAKDFRNLYWILTEIIKDLSI